MNSITIIDIGHGNCTVIRADDQVLLVDVGPRNGVLEYLRNSGITKINKILISHADDDHIGGLIGLISSDEIEIELIRINTDSRKQSKIWDDLLILLSSKQHEDKLDVNVSLTTNDSNKFDFADFKLEILAPSTYLAGKGPGGKDRKKRTILTNSISTVVKVYFGDDPVMLLPGDIDDIGLDELMHSTQNFQARIMIFPHHGGNIPSGNLKDFVKKLCKGSKSEIIVFSTGRGNNYRTPNPLILDEIKKLCPSVKILCTQLSINCSSVVPKVIPKYLSDNYSKGKEENKCCAGTIVFDLDDKSKSIPIENDHNNFVTNNISNALCQ